MFAYCSFVKYWQWVSSILTHYQVLVLALGQYLQYWPDQYLKG
jgi:hypothetical protein